MVVVIIEDSATSYKIIRPLGLPIGGGRNWLVDND